MSGQKTERRKYERGKSDVVEYFLNTSIDNRPNEEESTIEESSMSEYSEFFFSWIHTDRDNKKAERRRKYDRGKFDVGILQ